MKKILFIAILFSVLFPFSIWAFSDEPVLTTILAKKNAEAYGWAISPRMALGESFDFLIIIKNNSAGSIIKTTAQVKLPDDFISKNYIKIDGIKKEQDIKFPVEMGVFLAGEEKILIFEAKSKKFNLEELKREISLKFTADKHIYYNSIGVVLAPYSFKGIKIAKSAGIAAVAFSVKEWYLWIILTIAVSVYLFRLFLHLFSAPRG